MDAAHPRRPAGPVATTTLRALPLIVMFVAAGCGLVGGTTRPGESDAPSGSPGSSDSTACSAAPAPPGNLEGWTSAPTEPSVLPVIVNSSGSLTCGPNRLLFTFLDADNRPVGSPDRSVSISLFDLGRDGANPTQTVEGTFVWGIENERGFYVAEAEFAEAGDWGAEITTSIDDAAPETIRMVFEVETSTPVVRVGDPAPESETPTGASVDGDLARISTDPNPDPALYQLSVKDAIAAHDPFVLIFATPKFCTSAQCGPTLDRIKPLASSYPTVTFIHAEPYELTFQDGGLQPVRDAGGALIPTQAVFDWGLLSEPWVFVVDRDGIVTASFEGVVGTDELRAAIEAVR
jgi:hypothetical protein